MTIFIVDKFDWLAYNGNSSKTIFLECVCYLSAMTKEVKG